MNCSHNCKMCRICRYMCRHAKNFIIKTLCVINAFSLVFWICLTDSVISWQPYLIILVNSLFLWLVAYVNGWVCDTKPYYDYRKKVIMLSVYREDKPLMNEDKFTFEDSQILKSLRESDKLTEREKLAVQRLYRTYQYMVD